MKTNCTECMEQDLNVCRGCPHFEDKKEGKSLADTIIEREERIEKVEAELSAFHSEQNGFNAHNRAYAEKCTRILIDVDNRIKALEERLKAVESSNVWTAEREL